MPCPGRDAPAEDLGTVDVKSCVAEPGKADFRRRLSNGTDHDGAQLLRCDVAKEESNPGGQASVAVRVSADGNKRGLDGYHYATTREADH